MANYTKTKYKSEKELYKHNGFLYQVKRTTPGVVYLKCALRSDKDLNCLATAKLDRDVNIISVNNRVRHSHDEAAYEEEKYLLKQRLKEAAVENLTAPIRQIFNEITRNHPSGEDVAFG